MPPPPLPQQQLPGYETGAPGGAKVWEWVKKLKSPTVKESHVCLWVENSAICGKLLKCSTQRGTKTFVTQGATNHFKQAHPNTDIGKGELTRLQANEGAAQSDIADLADAGGSGLVPFSNSPEARSFGRVAMNSSSAGLVVYGGCTMSMLNDKYYRENMACHIKFCGGNPALAPITNRNNIRKFIKAEYNRKCARVSRAILGYFLNLPTFSFPPFPVHPPSSQSSFASSRRS